MVPQKHELPKWFIEKWCNYINFDGNYWHSHCEYKRYAALGGFNEDVQQIATANNCSICLIYFADEGTSTDFGEPPIFIDADVIFAHISEKSIQETRPATWMNEDYNQRL